MQQYLKKTVTEISCANFVANCIEKVSQKAKCPLVFENEEKSAIHTKLQKFAANTAFEKWAESISYAINLRYEEMTEEMKNITLEFLN